MVGSRICLALVVVLVAGGAAAGRSASRGDRLAPQTPSLDTLFGDYRVGGVAALERTFTRPRDFQDRARLVDQRALDGWLREWDRGKAAFMLDLTHVAFRVAPQYAPGFLRAGRRFVGAGAGGRTSSDDTAFVVTWHRAALGLLEGYADPALVEEHADAVRGTPIGKPPDGPLSGRLLLARAVAQERRCWNIRPALVQSGIRLDELFKAAGAPVPRDLDAPPPVSKADVDAHRTCVREALARFDAAAASGDERAEAHIRGGWLLFQTDRPQEAVAWLDDAPSSADRPLAYWRHLFRGRVLSALGRHQESANDYRAAFELYPAAQSAGAGLAIQLFRLDQAGQADDLARGLRHTSGADPWTDYLDGDRRFLDDCLTQLRKALQ